MGDGLVEMMNRSLLTLLRTLVDEGNDWEDHLQLMLFFYRTNCHGASPYEVLFGSNPPSPHIPSLREVTPVDTDTYHTSLQHKLIKLRELVEAHIVRSANDQQHSYNCNPREALAIGRQLLLQNPTAQKLDPRWTGPWTVTEIKSPLTIAITKGDTIRVVHVNRIHPFLEVNDSDNGQTKTSWSPPLFQQLDVDSKTPKRTHCASAPPLVPPQVVTRSGHIVKPDKNLAKSQIQSMVYIQ